MVEINTEYKPPPDYKPPMTRVNDKVMIPQEENPTINFVGLLIGPRGNTLKAMEKETGAKIIIRGKGSVKEGKVGRKDGQPLPGEDEPLHAYVTATNPEAVKKAVDKIKEIIKQELTYASGGDVPEGHNDLRRSQLRELALLNGTLREGDGPRCTNCGAADHKAWQCQDKPNMTNNIVCTSCGGVGHIAKDCAQKRPGTGFGDSGPPRNKKQMDDEYLSLMAELGEGPPPSADDKPSQSQGQAGKPGWQQRGMGGPQMFRPPGPPRPLMPPQPLARGPAPPPPPPGEFGGPPPPPPGTFNNGNGSWENPPPNIMNQGAPWNNQGGGDNARWTQPPPPGSGPPPPAPPPPRGSGGPPPPPGTSPGANSNGRSFGMPPPNYYGGPPPPPPSSSAGANSQGGNWNAAPWNQGPPPPPPPGASSSSGPGQGGSRPPPPPGSYWGGQGAGAWGAQPVGAPNSSSSAGLNISNLMAPPPPPPS